MLAHFYRIILHFFRWVRKLFLTLFSRLFSKAQAPKKPSSPLRKKEKIPADTTSANRPEEEKLQHLDNEIRPEKPYKEKVVGFADIIGHWTSLIMSEKMARFQHMLHLDDKSQGYWTKFVSMSRPPEESKETFQDQVGTSRKEKDKGQQGR